MWKMPEDVSGTVSNGKRLQASDLAPEAVHHQNARRTPVIEFNSRRLHQLFSMFSASAFPAPPLFLQPRDHLVSTTAGIGVGWSSNRMAASTAAGLRCNLVLCRRQVLVTGQFLDGSCRRTAQRQM